MILALGSYGCVAASAALLGVTAVRAVQSKRQETKRHEERMQVEKEKLRLMQEQVELTKSKKNH